jgi:hypothetical protein
MIIYCFLRLVVNFLHPFYPLIILIGHIYVYLHLIGLREDMHALASRSRTVTGTLIRRPLFFLIFVDSLLLLFSFLLHDYLTLAGNGARG